MRDNDRSNVYKLDDLLLVRRNTDTIQHAAYSMVANAYKESNEKPLQDYTSELPSVEERYPEE